LEQQFILGLTVLSRKQPGGVRSAKQRRSELMNIFINEIRQGLIELEIQIHSVLHIIVGENEPIRSLQPARLDKILAQLDANEIANANGRE
jgi:hypothetical protein